MAVIKISLTSATPSKFGAQKESEKSSYEHEKKAHFSDVEVFGVWNKLG